MSVAETVQYDEGIVGKIIWDDDTEWYNPRSEDFNIGTMICSHRNYLLGDEQLNNGEDISYRLMEEKGVTASCTECGEPVIALDWFEYCHASDEDEEDIYDAESGLILCHNNKQIRPELEGIVVLPLFLFDHSGISMSTSSTMFRMADSAGWDWGQVGVIYVTMEKMKQECNPDSEWFKKHWDGKSVEEAAIDILTNEVETYDLYLTGQCYGYVVEDAEGEEIDSCWGFLGDDSVKEEMDSTAAWAVEQVASRNAQAFLPIVINEEEN